MKRPVMKQPETRKIDLWAVGGLIVGLAMIAALAGFALRDRPAGSAGKTSPSKVEAIDGTKVKKVTLSKEGADRLSIQTVALTEAAAAGGKTAKSIPYGALVYLPDGTTWTYVLTEPLTFIRHPVTVDRVAGATVTLSQGPPAGTQIVSVGATELYGAETGVGK